MSSGIFLLLLKIIVVIFSLLLFCTGILIWGSIGKESLLISLLEFPLGLLFFYLGWKLFRWSSGGSDQMVGSTYDESNSGSWHSNDYH